MASHAESAVVAPVAPPNASEVHCKIANTYNERVAAYRLVYEKYVQKGLITENQHGLRITPYHLLPSTTTYLALHQDELIATVTLIADGEFGLPMESIYPDQVRQARQQGLFVGEVSAFAVRDMPFRRFLPIFLKLTRLMAQHARSHGMEQFLVAVHPKHAGFYQRLMGFEQIGEQKAYPSVSNAPAVACCLDFARVDREQPPAYDEIFGEVIPDEHFQTVAMTAHEREVFQLVSEFSGYSVPVTV